MESTYDEQNPVATKKWSLCPNDINKIIVPFNDEKSQTDIAYSSSHGPCFFVMVLLLSPENFLATVFRILYEINAFSFIFETKNLF